jgi:hypothetical protein
METLFAIFLIGILVFSLISLYGSVENNGTGGFFLFLALVCVVGSCVVDAKRPPTYTTVTITLKDSQ